MSRGDLTRRELLRGRARREEARPDPRPIVREGETLPGVISWLDPEMRATPRRGTANGAFPLLRPPGAIAEEAFLAACTRCGDCAGACPHDAIVSAPQSLREAAETPIIDPIRSPCRMCEDLPCIAACEPGALRSEAPAALGTASVQALDCLNRLGSPCSLCSEHCPVPGVVSLGEGAPSIDPHLCTGCGICQHVCPAPHNAIVMLPNADRPTPAALSSATSTSSLDPEPREPLPDLHQAVLDEAGLHELVRDLGRAARVLSVRLKAGAGRRAEGEASLEQAARQLVSGALRGVQVRYGFEGRVWCDTMLRVSEGYRVVRMEEPTRPEEPASS